MDVSRRKVIIHRQRRRENSGMGRIILRVVIGLVLLFVVANLALVFAGVGTVAGVYAYFAQDLPDPEKIEIDQETFETTKIYDRTGEHLLFEVFDPRPNRGDRTYTKFEEIPLTVREAVIALEDKTFYENPGVNFEGLGRAVFNNLRGLQVQGGSSITVQLVKNVLIPQEERYKVEYSRKIKEAILALEITRRYPAGPAKTRSSNGI